MRRNYKLSESQLAQMQQAIKKDKRSGVSQRAQALYRLHLGDSVQKVADSLLITRKTIYNWHDRWQANGVDGLADKAKSGRPRKATATYRQLLAELIEQEPATYGYEFSMWTNARMPQETGIKLSERAFGDLLKTEGYVYRRPKYDLGHLQDSEAIEQAKSNLHKLKKGLKQTNSSLSLWTPSGLTQSCENAG